MRQYSPRKAGVTMDELLMRGMPHSAEAEQAVLGSMLIDGDCVKDVMDQLQAEDFYLRQNREIFETIAHMFVYSQPVDGVTVASEMEKNGLYTDATRPYLLQLMEVTPTSANVGEYVKIVRDKALMRQVATAAPGRGASWVPAASSGPAVQAASRSSDARHSMVPIVFMGKPSFGLSRPRRARGFFASLDGGRRKKVPGRGQIWPLPGGCTNPYPASCPRRAHASRWKRCFS